MRYRFAVVRFFFPARKNGMKKPRRFFARGVPAIGGPLMGFDGQPLAADDAVPMRHRRGAEVAKAGSVPKFKGRVALRLPMKKDINVIRHIKRAW
jgi:hypothetical protein